MEAINSENACSAQKCSARDALLLAAQELFTEKGFSQVSTRELAVRANVNLGAIQYHFGSKAKLFIAAVHAMLSSCACLRAQLEEPSDSMDSQQAATRLHQFISGLLSYILRPTGPQATRVMCREILSTQAGDEALFDELVSSVVSQFSRPTHDALLSVLQVLSPSSSSTELSRVVASIVGQCTFYVTHRPFVERIQGIDLSTDLEFNALALHITQFTLRGLGCPAPKVFSD